MYHYQCETMILIGYWNSLSENASPWRLGSISHHIQTCLPNKKPLDSLPRWLHQFAFSASFSRYSECYTLSSVLGSLIYLSSASSVIIFVCISIFLVTDVKFDGVCWIFLLFYVFLSDCVFKPLNVYRLNCCFTDESFILQTRTCMCVVTVP